MKRLKRLLKAWARSIACINQWSGKMDKEKLAENMASSLHVLALVAICIGAIYFAHTMWKISNAPATKIEIQYDCRLAEISVDYPSEVKRKCRELMLPKAYAKHG